ncbi:MAG: hypothetical protein CL908_17835 [Deltaproteobacteria bacterium]|jgi:hypothetical protein|nr:hypothetical protein [Deltaproteobacteria bacterium]
MDVEVKSFMTGAPISIEPAATSPNELVKGMLSERLAEQRLRAMPATTLCIRCAREDENPR